MSRNNDEAPLKMTLDEFVARRRLIEDQNHLGSLFRKIAIIFWVYPNMDGIFYGSRQTA